MVIKYQRSSFKKTFLWKKSSDPRTHATRQNNNSYSRNNVLIFLHRIWIVGKFIWSAFIECEKLQNNKFILLVLYTENERFERGHMIFVKATQRNRSEAGSREPRPSSCDRATARSHDEVRDSSWTRLSLRGRHISNTWPNDLHVSFDTLWRILLVLVLVILCTEYEYTKLYQVTAAPGTPSAPPSLHSVRVLWTLDKWTGLELDRRWECGCVGWRMPWGTWRPPSGGPSARPQSPRARRPAARPPPGCPRSSQSCAATRASRPAPRPTPPTRRPRTAPAHLHVERTHFTLTSELNLLLLHSYFHSLLFPVSVPTSRVLR